MRMYLGGGGTADDERAVWAAALAGRRTVLYWPFAMPVAAHAGGLRWLRDGLAGHGAYDVRMWSTLAGRSPAELAAHDLLIVGGGNTYALLDEIRRHGWLDAVAAHVRGGGGYLGDSAGAVLAGADIGVAGQVGDPNDVGLTETGALDLLGGRDLWPHFGASDVDAARDWAGTTGRDVLGVPERGGLIVAEGAIRCAGPEPVWVVPDGPTLMPGDEVAI